MAKHYVGEIGTTIELDTNVDISTADVSISVLKPDASSAESWSAGVTDTTKVQYVLQSGDFDTAGKYKMQAVVVEGTHTWYGETVTINVYALKT